jgi:hypothetical protein
MFEDCLFIFIGFDRAAGIETTCVGFDTRPLVCCSCAHRCHHASCINTEGKLPKLEWLNSGKNELESGLATLFDGCKKLRFVRSESR